MRLSGRKKQLKCARSKRTFKKKAPLCHLDLEKEIIKLFDDDENEWIELAEDVEELDDVYDNDSFDVETFLADDANCIYKIHS